MRLNPIFRPHSSPSRRKLSRSLAVLLTTSALVLSACGSTEEEEGAEVEQAVALEVDPSRVMLQSTGAGPGRVLEFNDIPADEDGASPQETTIEVSQGFQQSVATGDAVDPAAPTVTDFGEGEMDTITLPLSATAAAADEPDNENEVEADRNVRWQLGTPTHSDISQNEDLASATGFRLGLRSNFNGQATTVQLAAPVEATDVGRQTAESALMKVLSLPVVFPDEAVGPGAIWSVDSRVTGEATLLQTTTYTLKEVSGQGVELDVSVTQRPALGALSLEGQEGMAEGEAGTLNVLNSNTTSTGSLSVDLGQSLPVAGRVEFTTRVIYGGEDSEVRVVQDSSSVLDFG
ncbi:hypothetical protein COCCU_09320 [Corynebacterium occultum]|uniref:Uncharacterized protein n=1 Tax=Corynebacterium occultum TaxID=2675219 RepID=A0A6B8WN69_9CORY|nr:hypothetical protein [Corynebacterium occultum]QGU07788.1 hypothetical protein COCCU_09320 [Corynebacterium occultum]